MEIVPGVHTIDSLGSGRAYLAVDADRVTVIDTGLKGSAERVLRAVEAAGRKPKDVRQIVITHYHGDHIGGLAELVERTGAQVMVHALDAPVVRGERPQPGPTSGGLLKPLINFVISRMESVSAPVAVDRELSDGDEIDALDGLRVVHTPGHTPGSICLFSPKRRLLFTGDAIATPSVFGRPLSAGTPRTRRRRKSRFASWRRWTSSLPSSATAGPLTRRRPCASAASPRSCASR